MYPLNKWQRFYVIIYTVYTPYCYLFTIEFRLKSFLAIKAGTERACSEPIIKNVGVPPDKCFCCRIAPICHCKAFIFAIIWISGSVSLLFKEAVSPDFLQVFFRKLESLICFSIRVEKTPLRPQFLSDSYNSIFCVIQHRV